MAILLYSYMIQQRLLICTILFLILYILITTEVRSGSEFQYYPNFQMVKLILATPVILAKIHLWAHPFSEWAEILPHLSRFEVEISNKYKLCPPPLCIQNICQTQTSRNQSWYSLKLLAEIVRRKITKKKYFDQETLIKQS